MADIVIIDNALNLCVVRGIIGDSAVRPVNIDRFGFNKHRHSVLYGIAQMIRHYRSRAFIAAPELYFTGSRITLVRCSRVEYYRHIFNRAADFKFYRTACAPNRVSDHIFRKEQILKCFRSVYVIVIIKVYRTFLVLRIFITGVKCYMRSKRGFGQSIAHADPA